MARVQGGKRLSKDAYEAKLATYNHALTANHEGYEYNEWLGRAIISHVNKMTDPTLKTRMYEAFGLTTAVNQTERNLAKKLDFYSWNVHMLPLVLAGVQTRLNAVAKVNGFTPEYVVYCPYFRVGWVRTRTYQLAPFV